VFPLPSLSGWLTPSEGAEGRFLSVIVILKAGNAVHEVTPPARARSDSPQTANLKPDAESPAEV